MAITPQHIRQANIWRNQYNPLRGLTMARAVALMEQGELGYYADLQWLYRFIEKRDAVLRALKRRRAAALLKLDWDIKVLPDEELPKGGTSAMAKRQKDHLQSVYEGIDNLREAVQFLALAEFRGYAHLEKHYSTATKERKEHKGTSSLVHLEPVPQWHWCRDGLYGEWQYNAEAQSTNKGEEIERENFIIREIDDPIDEIGLIAFLRKNLGEKDWDGFIESYGIPPLFIIGPPNVPKDKEVEYQETAEKVASDSRGYLPNGSDVKTAAAGERGINPFRDHLMYQNEQLVLAGTGGKLAMLNDATGIGGSQGEVHDEAFDDLAAEEAVLICEIFQRSIDEVELAKAFPGEPVMAYFDLGRDDEAADVKAFKREVYKIWSADGTLGDVLANQTDLKSLTRDVELPVNEEYIDPYVPVRDDTGAMVTGETVEDSEGDVVGGDAEEIQNADFRMQNDPRMGRFGNDQGPSTNAQRNPNGGNPNQRNGQMRNRAEFVRAMAADLAPVRKRLEAILRIEDPEILKNRLGAFQRELPRLLKDINADPASARVLEGMMRAAMREGAARKEREAAQ